MRILMLSDVYFPRVNGVSTSIQTFSRELAGKGHRVTLIAPDYGAAGGRAPAYGARHDPQRADAAATRGDTTGAESEPFEIIRVPSRYLPIDPEDRILRARRLRALRPMLATRGYQVLHIQTPFVAHYAGLGLARKLGIPVVESYHTFFEHYLEKYVPLVPPSWLRLAARRFSVSQCAAVDYLVVPSRAMLSVLHDYGVRTPAKVIPTGIDLGRFSPGDGARFRRSHGIGENRPVLVHVGRLGHEKNIDFLLRVLARVKREIADVLLVIAGEGPARASLEALGKKLGLKEQLLFVGYLGRDGPLKDCYCAGNAFVFASRTETQGLVLLEAMALGVPVVSTAVMGTKEVLKAGHGCLIADDDEVDFADQTLHLLADSSLRATLSTRALAYANTWSAPLLADRMIDLYETVIGEG